MDIEQLKLILGTVESVANTAGIAGVLWLVMHYFVLLVAEIALPVIIAVCVWIGCKAWMVTVKGFIVDQSANANTFVNDQVKDNYVNQLNRIRDHRFSHIHQSDVDKLSKAIDHMKGETK